MARSKIAGLVLEAWEDLDRVLVGLTVERATRQVDGQSSMAWTLGHVCQQVDSWINVNFLRLPPHPVINRDGFRMGSAGLADDWDLTLAGALEVRGAATAFLESLTDPDLDSVVPYSGSFVPLREHGLSLRYALLRIAAHHYFHIGVIACQRDRAGDQVGDYPGALRECM
jgi:DinB superfamily